MWAYAAIQPEQGIPVGALIADTLVELHMSQKEAAWLCGIDPAQFARALVGKSMLDLWRLRNLPARFWTTFLPKFMAALTTQWLEDVCADVKTMAVARLRPRDDERKKSA